MEELVSVIIPVYNVEKYLDRCVESVVNQTYKNLEIILVDDGSPDNCPAMCDEWAKKDERIKVIHKQNGGLSSARNAGLDNMSGEYVYFIDSDDYIELETIEVLYKLIIDNDADMAFGSYCRVSDEGNALIDNDFTDELYILNEDSFWEKHYQMHSNSDERYVNMIVSWNKLINKSVFNDLRFDIGKIHEDEYIIHKIVSRCNTIAFSEKKLYYY